MNRKVDLGEPLPLPYQTKHSNSDQTPHFVKPIKIESRYTTNPINLKLRNDTTTNSIRHDHDDTYSHTISQINALLTKLDHVHCSNNIDIICSQLDEILFKLHSERKSDPRDFVDSEWSNRENTHHNELNGLYTDSRIKGEEIENHKVDLQKHNQVNHSADTKRHDQMNNRDFDYVHVENRKGSPHFENQRNDFDYDQLNPEFRSELLNDRKSGNEQLHLNLEFDDRQNEHKLAKFRGKFDDTRPAEFDGRQNDYKLSEFDSRNDYRPTESDFDTVQRKISDDHEEKAQRQDLARHRKDSIVHTKRDTTDGVKSVDEKPDNNGNHLDIRRFDDRSEFYYSDAPDNNTENKHDVVGKHNISRNHESTALKAEVEDTRLRILKPGLINMQNKIQIILIPVIAVLLISLLLSAVLTPEYVYGYCYYFC